MGGKDLLDEVSEVVGDREACTTEVTSDQIRAVLEKGLDGGFLAAGFKWSHIHDDYSCDVLSNRELLRTWCLRKFSSMVSTPRIAA